MDKYSDSQQNRISEILGNISVAWFSGGIIVPILSKSPVGNFVSSAITGFLLFLLFFHFSLKFQK